jgi:hypothetical protein
VSNAALSAAHRSIFRKMESFATTLESFPSCEELDAEDDPEVSLHLADALEFCAGNLIIAIALLRCEAQAVIEARKGTVR